MRYTAKGTGEASFPSFKMVLCGRSNSLNCSGSCHLWTMPCSVCRGESLVVGLMRQSPITGTFLRTVAQASSFRGCDICFR